MMTIPFVIDNQDHRLADVLRELLARSPGKPLDVATIRFAVSSCRLVQEGLRQLGAFRLFPGAETTRGSDVERKPSAKALASRLCGELESEPFSQATLTLVGDLIAFRRNDKVHVRLYDKGFLHAKAYLFHQDHVGPRNRADRFRPFVAIVGSSNFTGPGLASNRELNPVRRVILPEEDDDEGLAQPQIREARRSRCVNAEGQSFWISGVLHPSGGLPSGRALARRSRRFWISS
jgi:hypothetical protein